MQSIDMLLETTREFLHQLAALLPRLTLALAVLLVGWVAAKAVRFAVERALRAVNFHVLTERAGTDNFLQQQAKNANFTANSFWLGGLNQHPELFDGQWRWVDGLKFSYTNWAVGR